MGIKYKIEKVELVKSGGWKNLNNLRNEEGMLNELENIANEIGELETSYHATTRAIAVAKVDKNTLDSLISQGNAKPHGK